MGFGFFILPESCLFTVVNVESIYKRKGSGETGAL